MDSGWLCIAGAVILIILLIVTVVGHGIWMAVAAVFDKKRAEMLALVEGLKQWQ